MENIPSPGGGGLSADIIRGKKYEKREEKKEENVKEKGESHKTLNLKGSINSKGAIIKLKRVCEE